MTRAKKIVRHILNPTGWKFNFIADLDSTGTISSEFWFSLAEEDDWSFIIKLSAVIEAALANAIVLFHKYSDETSIEAVRRLTLEKKIKTAKQIGVLDSRSFPLFDWVRKVRNRFTHDLRFLIYDLDRLLAEEEKLADALYSAIRNVLGEDFDRNVLTQTRYLLSEALFSQIFEVQIRAKRAAENFKENRYKGLAFVLSKRIEVLAEAIRNGQDLHPLVGFSDRERHQLGTAGFTGNQIDKLELYFGRERTRALKWEYSYLMHYLSPYAYTLLLLIKAMGGKLSLTFIVALQRLTNVSSEEWNARLNALQTHELIRRDGEMFELTSKGADYVLKRGFLIDIEKVGTQT